MKPKFSRCESTHAHCCFKQLFLFTDSFNFKLCWICAYICLVDQAYSSTNETKAFLIDLLTRGGYSIFIVKVTRDMLVWRAHYSEFWSSKILLGKVRYTFFNFSLGNIVTFVNRADSSSPGKKISS